jgi:VanZ family protein
MWVPARWRLAALFYAGLIIYGSLFPLTGWTEPVSLFSFLTAPMPAHISRADLFTNVLAYIPLGVFIAWSADRRRVVCLMSTATGLGAFLSFIMESMQMFLPSRTASNIDIALNVAGTLIGVAGAAAFQYRGFSIPLRGLRRSWFEAGRAADTVLSAALFWMCAQLSPFLPSMDVSSIRAGLAPIWHGMHNLQGLSVYQTAVYALNIAGLALLVSIVALPRRPVSWLFLALAGFVLCAKPFIVARVLSLEAVAGFVAAVVLVLGIPRNRTVRLLSSGAFIVAAFVISELAPVDGGVLYSFNWIPLAGQTENTVNGFQNILETVWPFMAVTVAAILAFGKRRPLILAIGAAIAAMVFALEWEQRYISGRHGDISAMILAILGWAIAWVYNFDLR